MKKMLMALTVPLLSLLSCATTSTRVTSSWMSPDHSGTIHNVLVVGVSNVSANRVLYENNLVEELKKHGVKGIPSFTVMTSTGMPDRATVVAAVKDSGADSVLLVQLIDRENIRTYVPGSVSPAFGDFYDYYAYSWGYVYNPGYTLVNRVVALQTNLYSASDQKLFWTATTDTTTQGSNSDVIRSFTKTIVDRMLKERLIG